MATIEEPLLPLLRALIRVLEDEFRSNRAAAESLDRQIAVLAGRLRQIELHLGLDPTDTTART
jgi:ribosomal protein S15P/S13E